MSREQTPGSTSGRHFWFMTTTKEDAERELERYKCKNCDKEVLE